MPVAPSTAPAGRSPSCCACCRAGRPLAALAGAVQPFTDAVYRLVAGNRTRLGPLIPERVKARADAAIARRQAEHTR